MSDRVGRRAVVAGGIAVASLSVLSACGGPPTRDATPSANPGGRLVSPMLAHRPFTVAHRGGSADWPEESEFAYQRSANSSADALEMSVARTADGVWFGSHDPTLDRLSGTSGFLAADRTWAEVRRLRIRPPDRHPRQASRPYWRLEDLLAAYRSSHALWIDPKAVNPRYYTELVDIIRSYATKPGDLVVAKSPAANTAWGELARENGLQSWGFYYGSDLDADGRLFARTQAAWTLLGLDWNASAAWWSTFVADGRPVIAHVIATRSERAHALERGADGLMISGITEVLG